MKLRKAYKNMYNQLKEISIPVFRFSCIADVVLPGKKLTNDRLIFRIGTG